MTNSDHLKEEVKKIVCSRLNVEKIADDAKQENFSEWDSMAYLAIVAELEQKYNIRVTPDNINNFNSLNNILREIVRVQHHS